MGKTFYGTATAEVDGQAFALVMNFNAAAFFEAQTGRNFFEVVSAWEDDTAVPSGTDMVHFIHAALQEHHPDLTFKDAGNILSKDMECLERLSVAAQKGSGGASTGKKPRQARKH